MAHACDRPDCCHHVLVGGVVWSQPVVRYCIYKPQVTPPVNLLNPLVFSAKLNAVEVVRHKVSNADGSAFAMICEECCKKEGLI